MKFSEFCDTIENTEQEQQFLQFLKEDADFNEVKENLEKVKKIPVLGKICKAMVALVDSESIAEFRESEYYPQFMDWNITFDPDAKNLSLSPGDAQKKKAVKIFSIVAAVIAVLLLVRKFPRRKKKV